MRPFGIPLPLLLGYLVLVAGVGGAAQVYHRTIEQRFRNQVEERLQAIADLKVSELVHWRQERLGDAAVIAETPQLFGRLRELLAGAAAAGTEDAIRSWLRAYRRHFQYSRIRLVDAGGGCRLCEPAEDSTSCHVMDEHLPRLLAAGQPDFLDFHQEPGGVGPHLGLVVPVQDDRQRPLGALLIRIDPEAFLYPSLRRWPDTSRSAETLLVRRDGDAALCLNPLRQDPSTVLHLRTPLVGENLRLPEARAALGAEGLHEGVDPQGRPVLAMLRQVPASPWALVVRQDLAEALAPLHEREWQLLAFIVVLLGGGAAAFGLVWRQQRLRHLQSEQASEQRFRLLFQHLTSGFALHELICDPQGRPRDYRFLAINPAFERLTGLRAADLVGRTVLEVMPRTEPEWIERYGQVALSGEPIRFEQFARELDRHYEVSAYSPAPGQFAVLFNDISVRCRAEVEIRRLNTELEHRVAERTAGLQLALRELEAFSYSVSHDLRTPLRAIEGFSHILLEEHATSLDAEGRSCLERICQAVTRMGLLIDDLLRLSRVARTELQPEAVDLGQVAESVLAELRQADPDRQVEAVLSPGLLVRADPGLVRVLLANLLGNAWKFTSRHPLARIELAETAKDGERVFLVRDDGAGFDMQYAGKLFGPFQRLHSQQDFAGTGIGLAIVQRIVQRHGGRCWAEAHLEKGATFFFTLPLAEQT